MLKILKLTNNSKLISLLIDCIYCVAYIGWVKFLLYKVSEKCPKEKSWRDLGDLEFFIALITLFFLIPFIAGILDLIERLICC